MGKKRQTKNGSRFLKYLIPLHEVLKEMGGSASSYEATDRVIEKCKVSVEEQRKMNKSNIPQVRNDIAWARLYLMKSDLIDNAQRGIWRLTDLGWKTGLKPGDELKLFADIQSQLAKRNQTSNKTIAEIDDVAETDQSSADPDDDFRERLLNTLCALPAYGFEKICRRLLQESGFEEVEVTKQSRDGGIDGFGILRTNKFVSQKIAFQCKRYSEQSVGSVEIQQFRGAMSGSDRGIYITTSWFTSDARKEAKKPDQRVIELIDGETLVDIFIDLKLGVRPTFEVDSNFFDLFAKEA